MPTKTDELRTQALGPMPTPAELSQAHPITEEVAQRIAHSRRQIEQILTGEDDRLLVIVGPCSVHDTEAALDYGQRLSAIQEQYSNELFIVMRTYFEKPRTVIGWKGLITGAIIGVILPGILSFIFWIIMGLGLWIFTRFSTIKLSIKE